MTVLSVLSPEVDWRTSVRRQDSAGAETRKGRVPDNAAAPGSAASPRRRLSAGLSRPARSCAVTTATAIRPRCLRRPTAARRCSRCMPSITRSRGCARAVTQPMLGQIRLQWWREVIEAAYAGGAGAAARGRTRRWSRRSRAFGLSRAHFDRIIDTRERDLDDAPPADLAALVDYAEGTSSALLLSRAGGARGRRSGSGRGGARGRDRLCACRAVAGDAVSRRFRTLVHPAGCRGAGRARSGSLCASARHAGAAQSDRRVGRDGGGASRGGTAQRRSNRAAGAGRPCCRR